MKLEKAERRDKKRRKQRSGMQVDNKSIFVILDTIKKSKHKKRKKK